MEMNITHLSQVNILQVKVKTLQMLTLTLKAISAFKLALKPLSNMKTSQDIKDLLWISGGNQEEEMDKI